MSWEQEAGLSFFCVFVVTAVGWVVIHRHDTTLSNYTGTVSNYAVRVVISFATGCVVCAIIGGAPIWIPVWIIVHAVRSIRKSLSVPRTFG